PYVSGRLDGVWEAVRLDLLAEEIAHDAARVSEEALRERYERNTEALAGPERRRLWAIFIDAGADPTEEDRQAARERIETAQQRLASGEDFAELAEEMAEGPSRDNGGDFGPLSERELPALTRATIWSLAEGEISEVVDLPHGFAIFRTTDWEQPSPPSFEESRIDLIAELREQLLVSHRLNWREERGVEIAEFAVGEEVSPEAVILVIGDQTWRESDLDRWLDARVRPNLVGTISDEDRVFHRIRFQEQHVEREYVRSIVLRDEEAARWRWEARRNHTLAQSLISAIIEECTPDDEALQRILDAHWRDWPFSIDRLVSTILISTAPRGEGVPRYYGMQRAEERLAELTARLEAGEDFAALAGEFSDHPSGASDGGRVGWIHEPSRAMFDVPLQGTEVGDITEPQLFSMGYVIHLVEDMRPTPLSEIRNELLGVWQNQAAQNAIETLIAALGGESEPDWRALIEDSVRSTTASMAQ
ncbi:peptidylprolyl isomerase, partial [Candidatus Sumerlaeota bacterium]|nr:peptidylprolyl isomerase [Candidatus Sumerlaeota bacterium]